MGTEYPRHLEAIQTVWMNSGQQPDEPLPSNVRPPAMVAFSAGVARARAERAGRAFAPRRFDGYDETQPQAYVGHAVVPPPVI